VILAGVNMDATTGHLPQLIPIDPHDRGVVTHAMAKIHAVKGRAAAPPHSAHDGMDKSRDSLKRQELKQIVLFIFYQKQTATLDNERLQYGVLPEMIAFGSGKGRSDVGTAGVAALR